MTIVTGHSGEELAFYDRWLHEGVLVIRENGMCTKASGSNILTEQQKKDLQKIPLLLHKSSKNTGRNCQNKLFWNARN